MKKIDWQEIGYVCLGGLAFLSGAFMMIALTIGFKFGLLCLLAWLVTIVAAGFGYQLPFWPVVGAIVLLAVFSGFFRGGSH